MPVLISLLLHCALVAAFAVKLPETKPAASPSAGTVEITLTQSAPVKALPQPQETPAEFLPPIDWSKLDDLTTPKPEADGIESRKAEVESNHDCKDGYEGVGIESEQDGFVTYITEVAPGYPAWKAGIQVGDQLLNPSEMRGPIGSVTYIMIIRDGQSHAVKVTRARICTKAPSK